MGSVVGDPERLRLNLLAGISRLFGDAAADRVEAELRGKA
jgi:hypothetical protein